MTYSRRERACLDLFYKLYLCHQTLRLQEAQLLRMVAEALRQQA